MDLNLGNLLQRVAHGELSVAEAEAILAARADINLGFARVDLDRLCRRGLAEAPRPAHCRPESTKAVVSGKPAPPTEYSVLRSGTSHPRD